MNMSNLLRQYYVFPAAGFIQFPNLCGYLTYTDSGDETTDQERPPLKHGWRIDGATFGVYYWAIPMSIHPCAPMNIHVKLPDQTEWPPELWGPLGARDSVHMSDQRIRSLGISKHLTRALDLWWERDPSAVEAYKNLPFGSLINCKDIKSNVEDMSFEYLPNWGLEELLLTPAELQTMWGFKQMPEAINIEELQAERQIQASISLVWFLDSSGSRNQYVFKGRAKINALYHEIKMLLSIPSHPNIIKGPVYLVTTGKSSVDGQDRVCGFLLPYHEAGALQEALPRMRLRGELKLQDQIRWSRQITAALQHVMSSPALFYSDLKMDNILLGHAEDEVLNVVLSDFEQSRSFYNWAPPEVYYIEWIAELGHEKIARSGLIDNATSEKYCSLFYRYLLSKRQSSIATQKRKYDNPPNGWYFPWLLSSPAEREAHLVYSLGKVLWCIFEGEGDADIILGRSLLIDADRTFPEFNATPPPIQDLIKRCTAGAREWKDGTIGIVRRGGQVYPLGRSGAGGEPTATLEETKDAIKSFWQSEMVKAERHALASIAYNMGKAQESDIELLDYLHRPKILEVLETLHQFSLPPL
ncbi:hypothetical protein FQN57_002573 [Myotisia sp. PD_48]|nr:hypothetical protein FQN57_002573 [Myotisia sp. PD_48]